MAHIQMADESDDSVITDDHKRRTTTDELEDSGSSEEIDSSKTKFSGTGKSDIICPDTITSSMGNVIIPRPIDNITGYTIKYQKNHSLISYGLGWKIMQRDINDPDKYLITTSLMSLPVDRPFFYMSPSEFDALPMAAYIKELKCKVIMRSPRTAFETNASITKLATLNNHEVIGHAEGLNLSTRSIDVKIGFSSGSNTMIPDNIYDLTIDQDEYLALCMYGKKPDKPNKPVVADKLVVADKPVVADKSDSKSKSKSKSKSDNKIDSSSRKRKADDTNYNKSYAFAGFHCVPRSFFNLPFACNRYLTLPYDAKEDEIGFPQMNKFVKSNVASYFVDKTILNYSYTPKIGYVTQPPQMRTNGYWGEDNFDIINMNGNITSRRMNINKGTVSASPISLGDVEDPEMKDLCKLYKENMYYCPIEKSQYISMGLDNNSNGKVQPSVHVGLYPVPEMTTTDLDNIPQKFCDVSVQWDIETECVIGFGYSNMNLTHFPHGNIVNIENGFYTPDHKNKSENLYFQTKYSTIHNAHIAKFQ